MELERERNCEMRASFFFAVGIPDAVVIVDEDP